MKLRKLAQVISLICIAAPAVAQQTTVPAAPQKIQKVEVTGSSIKRIQDEGATPIQVITKDEIDRAGITSAEQLLERISANGNGAYNLASQQGFATSLDRIADGQSNANLRGLGPSSTLVLLNGRRVSTHGLSARAVDLNSIPLAAVLRVEILKDGASAIYGTDAIGGVINFILRKDYNGAELTAFSDVTEQGGGNIHRGSLLAGFGSLESNRYNVMASLTFDRSEHLDGAQRDFSNGFQPGRGLSPDTTGTPFANIQAAGGTALGAAFRLPGDAQLYSRFSALAFENKCETIPRQSLFQAGLWGNPLQRYACAYDYGSVSRLQQDVERINVVSRATFKISENHSAYLELVGSQTTTVAQFTESQLTSPPTNYPAFVNGVRTPYYQNLSSIISTFNPNLPIRVRWRCLECGPRTIESESQAMRSLLAFEGIVGGAWDYKLGVSTGKSKVNSLLKSGYFFVKPFSDAFQTGLINPFLRAGQTQTPEALALINGARADGARLYGGEATLTQYDGTLSGELMQLPAGPLYAAAGFDLRRESYRFRPDAPLNPDTTVVIRDAGGDPLLNKADRDITAFFGELSIPILKSLEAQVAIRRDDYSLVGTTTNPKVAIKFQPMNNLLFRASASEGFIAPGYVQLYSGEITGVSNTFLTDPACPVTDPAVCVNRFTIKSGGNVRLKPETAKQWAYGFAMSPTNWMSFNVDAWRIERKNRIVKLDVRQVLDNFRVLSGNIVRSTDGSIDFIQADWANSAQDITKGVDLGININGDVRGAKWTASFDGSYLDSFKTRLFATQPFQELAGKFGAPGNFREAYIRWKHNASFNVNSGPWSATVSQRYVGRYQDQAPLGVSPPGFDPTIHSYILYNTSVSYTGLKNTTLTFGIKNILNTDPPFSAHNVDDVGGAGWDARVGDPRGRAYTARVTYRF